MYQERASWNWFVTPVHEQVVVTCRYWAVYNGEINFVLVVDQNVDQYVNVGVWRRFLFYFLMAKESCLYTILLAVVGSFYRNKIWNQPTDLFMLRHILDKGVKVSVNRSTLC